MCREKHGCPESWKDKVALRGDNPRKHDDAQGEQIRCLARSVRVTAIFFGLPNKAFALAIYLYHTTVLDSSD